MNAALPCENFGEFKKALNTLRTKDDKVIYGLNRLLPTASFKDKVDATSSCTAFSTQLHQLHTARSDKIQACITFNEDLQRTASDARISKMALRNVRAMKQEMKVEAVVNERSSLLFREKCHPFIDFSVTL